MTGGGPWAEGGRYIDTTAAWDCEAYGPEAREIAACFFTQGPPHRLCDSRAMCARMMAAERVRLWTRMQHMSITGTPAQRELWAGVLAEIDGPNDLLGGRDT